MDDWTKELEKWLEPIAREVAAVVDEATEQVDRWVEQSIQEIDRVTSEWQQVQQQVETHLSEVWGIEVDRLRQELDASIAPLIEEWRDWLAPFGDDYWMDDANDPPPSSSPNQYDAIYEQLNPKVPPTPDRHAACIGCQHYHGRLYNGTLLVCGMHPFGWETGSCPDWESDGPPPPADADFVDRP